MMNRIFLNFHGSIIDIRCDRKEFLSGTKLILKRNIITQDKIKEKPNLIINFIEANNFWSKDDNPQTPEALASQMEQIGRRVFINGKNNIFVKQFVDYSGLSCWYYKETMNLIYDIDSLAGHNDIYRTIYILTTIFPIATYLAKYRNMFFLHGGAVKFSDKNIAFLGLQGVGKSTLMLRMLREPNSKFLSDNIYFHDSSKLFACPETLRLDNKSLEFICPPDDLLVDTGLDTDLGRKMYIVNEERCMNSCEPDIFLIPRFSPYKSEIKPVSEDVITLISGFNELALELRAFAQWSAPFVMMEQAFLSKRIESLRAILNNKPVYHLLIKKGDAPDTIIDMIKRTI